MAIIARRLDRDDVLVRVNEVGYAVVHLVWGTTAELPPWPKAEVFDTWAAWAAAARATSQ